jgi:hypothetical protein
MADLVKFRKEQFRATAEKMEEENPPTYLQNPYSKRWIQYGGRAYHNLKSGKYVDIRTREREKARTRRQGGRGEDDDEWVSSGGKRSPNRTTNTTATTPSPRPTYEDNWY